MTPPFAAFARVNLDQLYLPFLERLFRVIQACQARSCAYVATSGYRTFGEQLADWSRGRTQDPEGRVVTNAGPGESPHNFGLAVDFVRVIGITPSWTPADYDTLGEEAKRAGLVWGGDFHGLVDRPHVQLAGYVSKEELAPLKAVYLASQDAPTGPLQAVFDHLNQTEKSCT